jgi:hypothetical protein
MRRKQPNFTNYKYDIRRRDAIEIEHKSRSQNKFVAVLKYITGPTFKLCYLNTVYVNIAQVITLQNDNSPLY